MYVWEERAKNVSDEAGVYALYNKDKALIFLGGSANLRETFTRYLETNFLEDPRKNETRYYRREFTQDWEERVQELLNEARQETEELPKINNSQELPKNQVPRELWFYFYKNFDEPLFEAAFNLEEFMKKIKKISVTSIEFHQNRGDFARWVQDVLKETLLAEKIEKIRGTGEELRRELLDVIRAPRIVECPKCQTKTNPLKSWKMAGNPSKTGERLQLTIGFYKCNNCRKAFRKVLRKEKIKAKTPGQP